MSEPFTYKNLSDPARQIRLLRLLPARKHSSIVKCVLEVADFEPTPQYEAISYAWGDATITRPIMVDDCDLQVTENLEAALRNLRSDEPRVLWADAVCINQRNADEKNQQVRRMGDIFAKASHVMIWLGDADKTTALAFSTLERLASVEYTMWLDDDENHSVALSVQKQLRGSASATFSSYMRKIRRQPPCTLVKGKVELRQFLRRRAAEALINLFQRSWWQRLWVKQEHLLSQSSTLACGRFRLITELFHEGSTRLALLLCRASSTEWVALNLYSVLNSIEYITTTTQSFYPFSALRLEKCPLLYVLSEVNGDCVDPRDKIFAVLSLASDGLVDSNQPDYGLSVEQVYLRLARTSIISKNNLNVLGFCELLWEHNPSTNLPSWVPDWRIFNYRSMIRHSLKTEISALIYNASLDSSVDYEFFKIGKSDILSLAGFQVSMIDELGDVVLNRGDNYEKPTDPPLNHWQLLAQEVSADPGVFWLTCMLDIWYDERIEPQIREDTIRSFQNWVWSQTAEWPNQWQSLDGVIPYSMRFFISGSTRMGMAPRRAQVGDLICILFGGQTPFVLRKREPEGYLLVGECYVHGIMDGEAMTSYEAGEYVKERFDLY